MEVLKTNKGGFKIVLDGHMYTKHSTRKSKIWWKCTKRSSMSCRGSIVTDLQNQNPEVRESHNHPDDEAQISLAKVRLRMKQQAADTRDKPSQIFAQVVADCDTNIRAMLPNQETCKRTMRNQRPTPPVPSCLTDLGSIPDEFSTTSSGEPFLIYDNGANNPNRILAYSTTDSLRRLAQSETIYMDGTFKTAPTIFTQIFCMRIPFKDTAVNGSYRQRRGQGMTLNVRRAPPLFSPDVWNVHNAVLNNAPCTNNICEGWNNKFHNLVGQHHPSIWRVVEWFQKEEATVQTIIAQDAVGNPPVKRVKKKFIKMQNQLRNLCRDRQNGTKSIPEFLRGVGWNIRLNKEI